MVYYDWMANAAPTTQPNELDAVFSALSNPTRRSLITRLGASDATVSELAEPLAMTLPAVSKHLRVLEDAGLVSRTREGKARRCTLRPNALDPAEAWIAERREFWARSLESLSTYLDIDHGEAP